MSKLSSLLLALLASCASVDYDLSSLPFPVSAQPAPATSGAKPFELEAKQVLWIHGLAGERQPDVARLLKELEPGPKGIFNLRVEVGASFHDWLLTHLSLTLVRMKSVRITGQAH